MISTLLLPDQILSWLVNLRHCNSRAYVEQQKMDAAILEAFCSMSVKDWYTLSVLMARHLNTEKFIYRVRPSLYLKHRDEFLCCGRSFCGWVLAPESVKG